MNDVHAPGSRKRCLLDLLIVFGVFFLVRSVTRAADVSLGGPIATVAALVAALTLSLRGGGGLASLGLLRPRRWSVTIGVFLAAFAITAVCGILLLPYLHQILGAPEGSGRFDYLEGNAMATLLSIVGIAWIAAAFGEEVVWRGFAIPRLEGAMGGSRVAAWLAVLLQAAVFGLLHHGAAGAIVAGLIGLGYGILFRFAGRNLWPLVAAHAVPDTISFLGIYAGG